MPPPTNLTSVRVSPSPVRARLSLESLDGRIMPALYTWTGMVDTDAANMSNWMVMQGMIPGQPPPPPPGLPDGDDELIFGPMAFNSRDCVGLASATDSFATVRIQSGYNGTVSLGEALTFGVFDLGSGAIAQPTSGTDLNITGAFTWTGGTLNNSTNAANVTITGATATALFAPTGGGTVLLGSNISIENGADATVRDGTIDGNKADLKVETKTSGSLFVEAGAYALLGATQFLQGVIGLGSSWTVGAGADAQFKGQLTNLGTYTLLPGAKCEVTGKAFDPAGDNIAYVQSSATGKTLLHGNSELVTPNNMTVTINIGTLATVYDPGASTGNATIRTKTLVFREGDIYINYGSGSGSHYHFGELVVDGNVKWIGGTFHVYVYSDGTTGDVWRTTNPGGGSGRFDIDVGAVVAPVFVDSDYGTSSDPSSGEDWEVLKAGGGFVDEDAPTNTNPSQWSMVIDDEGNPPIYWRLIVD